MTSEGRHVTSKRDQGQKGAHVSSLTLDCVVAKCHLCWQ